MKDLEKLSTAIRVSSLKMVHKSGASHIASALSITDILSTLYGKVLNYDVTNEYFEFRDRFILSKGHACVAVYAVLAEVGFFEKSYLESYGEDFSDFMNHISHKVPGVEFSTGALGHGLPFGVGKSLFAKRKKMNWHTYVLMSDGELDEGSNWEAFLFASHHQLSNLTAIIDYNKLQSLTTISDTLELEPLFDKLKSFGWFVVEADGHDHEDLLKAFKNNFPSKPKVVIAHTTKGKGVSFMEDRVKWHYKNPNDKELNKALMELNEK